MKISMQALAELIKKNCPCVAKAEIRGTWEDYGANMWWETIIITYIREDGSIGTYQALCPRDHKILNGEGMTVEQAQDFIDKINKRGW